MRFAEPKTGGIFPTYVGGELFLTKKGDVYEVNNGRGKASWESERIRRVIGS